MQEPDFSLRRSLAGPLAAAMALPAAAHVPFLEEGDYTAERPYVVHDVTNSKSLHARIGKSGDVDFYRIDLDQPARIHADRHPRLPAVLIGISNKENSIFDEHLKIPTLIKSFYPIIEVIPIQILSYYLAVKRETNPDYPRNLAKSVTVR